MSEEVRNVPATALLLAQERIAALEGDLRELRREHVWHPGWMGWPCDCIDGKHHKSDYADAMSLNALEGVNRRLRRENEELVRRYAGLLRAIHAVHKGDFERCRSEPCNSGRSWLAAHPFPEGQE